VDTTANDVFRVVTPLLSRQDHHFIPKHDKSTFSKNDNENNLAISQRTFYLADTKESPI
jgi:hypothetical protein